MLPTMNQCANLLINEIGNGMGDKSTEELEIYEPYQALTLDVICRCALALQLDCQTNPHVSFRYLIF